MHLTLRTRILLFTVLPIVALTVAGLVIVNRTIESRTHQNIHEDLRRASAVLEDLLDARFDQLTVAGQVIVQDPRFFSVLTLPGGAGDPEIDVFAGKQTPAVRAAAEKTADKWLSTMAALRP